jgi:hypothetical protein
VGVNLKGFPGEIAGILVAFCRSMGLSPHRESAPNAGGEQHGDVFKSIDFHEVLRDEPRLAGRWRFSPAVASNGSCVTPSLPNGTAMTEVPADRFEIFKRIRTRAYRLLAIEGWKQNLDEHQVLGTTEPIQGRSATDGFVTAERSHRDGNSAFSPADMSKMGAATAMCHTRPGWERISCILEFEVSTVCLGSCAQYAKSDIDDGSIAVNAIFELRRIS